MIGKTLGLYFAGNFLRNTLSIFTLFLTLITVVDMVEFGRDLPNNEDVAFSSIFLVSLYRAPAFAENILPFAVLFGASLSLLLLNRRLELVVARASGVSVWQFLFPLALTAMLLGMIATAVYSPLALKGIISSKVIEAKIFSKTIGNVSSEAESFWLRVSELDGETVIRARVSQDHGTQLTGVTAYRFDSKRVLRERIDASTAHFTSKGGDNFYVLKDANITKHNSRLQVKNSVSLPVRITEAELRANQAEVSDNSIWELPQEIERARRSGKNELPFVTRIYSLTAQPLLFVAMVLLAGTISLTFARFGQNKKVILGGILAGFVLYVLSKLVITFGSNGLVPPLFATWSPAFVAILISMTVLLYQEDG